MLDFGDQERLLLDLLDEPAVIAVLEDELDMLLVDEFQDTSPIQLALFLKLARCARVTYWVGDIKQAIYGFRGSDAALMNAVLDTLATPAQAPEILGVSWRSRPALAALVNAVFVPVFQPALSASQVTMTAHRQDGPDGLTEPALAHWRLAGANQADQGRALGAGLRQLVDSGYRVFDVRQQAARPVRYGDIAVLAARNDQVMQLASALRTLGIPCATAQPGLLQTPEATLALACLRRLHDPSDTLATAEIIALTEAEAPEVWVSERLRYLAAGGAAERWRETAAAGQPAHPLLVRLAALRRQRHGVTA